MPKYNRNCTEVEDDFLEAHMRLATVHDRLAVFFGLAVFLVAVTVIFSPGIVSGPASVCAADETTPAPAATPAVGEEAASPAASAETPAAEASETGPAGSGSGVEEKPADAEGAAAEGAAANEAGAKTGDILDELNFSDKDVDAAKEKKGKEEAAPKDEELAAAPAPAAEKPTASDGGSSKESFLVWLYNSLGYRYVIIFLIITFNAVALFVMILLGMRRKVICPDDLVAAFEAKLNEKKYQEAYELAKDSRSFLGKVLAAGMSRLSDGYDVSREAMREVGEEQSMKLEQRNGYIALIAQIGPMFGLLGTVDGMVMAFDVIAHSNVTPKPSELAQGIGTALVTTVVGLWIAIPTLAFYHIIRNRLARQLGEVGALSDNLMKRFAGVPIAAKKS